MSDLRQNFLDSTRKLFRYYRQLGDQCLDRLTEAQLHYRPDPVSNNMATIVKHLHGNMLSRWTDFLGSDGEKPWRHRDGEFEDTLQTREEVLQAWQEGWQCLFDAVDPLRPEDADRIIYIRNDGHTVLEALQRQLTHYAYHVGQMVYLARHIKGDAWESLSIPKEQSEFYNKKRFEREKERRHFTDDQ